MRGFENRPWRSIRLSLEAWIELHWVTFLLRSPWRQRLFADPAPSLNPNDSGPDLDLAAWLPAVEKGLANGIKTPTCLERALVQQRMLSRRGLQVLLRIGVRLDCADDLDAHAWLEHPDLPPDLFSQDYRTLDRPPA